MKSRPVASTESQTAKDSAISGTPAKSLVFSLADSVSDTVKLGLLAG
jgi:hypothetical protein